MTVSRDGTGQLVNVTGPPFSFCVSTHWDESPTLIEGLISPPGPQSLLNAPGDTWPALGLWALTTRQRGYRSPRPGGPGRFSSRARRAVALRSEVPSLR